MIYITFRGLLRILRLKLSSFDPPAVINARESQSVGLIVCNVTETLKLTPFQADPFSACSAQIGDFCQSRLEACGTPLGKRDARAAVLNQTAFSKALRPQQPRIQKHLLHPAKSIPNIGFDFTVIGKEKQSN